MELAVEPGQLRSHMGPMNGDEIARLLYLSLLAVAVGGYFLVSNRQSLGKSARELAVWGLIFLGVIAGYGLWGDVADDVMPRQGYVEETGQISVPRSADGHYYLSLLINDVPVRFVVDTGASEMVLSLEDARRVGLDVEGLAYLGRANTANGVVSTATVRLREVELGPITDTNFRAAVNAGDMEASLLGMEYLSRFDSLEISEGVLNLSR